MLIAGLPRSAKSQNLEHDHPENQDFRGRIRIVTIAFTAVIAAMFFSSAKADQITRDFSGLLWESTNIIEGSQATFDLRWITDSASSINPSPSNPVVPTVTSGQFGATASYTPKPGSESQFALNFESITFVPHSPTCLTLQANGRSCTFSNDLASNLTDMDVVEIRNTTPDRDQLLLHSDKFGVFQTNAFLGTLSTLDIQPILFGLEDGIFQVVGGPIQLNFGIPGADLDPLLTGMVFEAGMIFPMGPPQFASAPGPMIGHNLLVLLAVGSVAFGKKVLERRKKTSRNQLSFTQLNLTAERHFQTIANCRTENTA